MKSILRGAYSLTLLVFLSGAIPYVDSLGLMTPNLFYVALIALVALGSLLVAAASGVEFSINVSSRFYNFIAIYSALMVVFFISAFYSSFSDISMSLLRARMWTAIVGLCFYWIFYEFGQPKTTIVITLIITLLLMVVDFVYGAFSNVTGRASGLFLNPTNAAQVVTMCFSVVFFSLKPPFRNLIFAVTTAAIFLSFSRASWLVFFAFILFAKFVESKRGLASLLASTLGSIILGAALAWLLLSGALSDFVSDTFLAEYLNANTLNRIGGGDNLVSDYSAKERESVILLALNGIDGFFGVFFGNGFATTHEWSMDVSVHNMYLLLLYEQGVLGLSLYVILLGFLFWTGDATARGIILVIALFSLFSHNVLDMPFLGSIFLAIAAGSARSARQVDPAEPFTDFQAKPET